jgi:hypothetical protein
VRLCLWNKKDQRAWNAKDWENWAQLHAENAYHAGPDHAQPLHGREAILTAHQGLEDVLNRQNVVAVIALVVEISVLLLHDLRTFPRWQTRLFRAYCW